MLDEKERMLAGNGVVGCMAHPLLNPRQANLENYSVLQEVLFVDG